MDDGDTDRHGKCSGDVALVIELKGKCIRVRDDEGHGLVSGDVASNVSGFFVPRFLKKTGGY